MNDAMDELTIEINSTVDNATSKITNLITSLNNLKTSLKGVIKESKNLTILKNNISGTKTSSKSYQKTKTFQSEESQLSSLGVDLNKYNLFSTTKTADSELLKYKDNLGQVVTINRKFTDTLDDTGKKLSDVKVRLSETHKELKNGTSLWSAFTKGISGFVVKATIIIDSLKHVSSRFADMVDNASKYEESLNLFTVTLGDYTDKALSFVNTFSDALYLDPANVMQYMGSFNSLVKGLGVGANNSYLMSKNLTQLVYDLSSFKNLNFEESFRKLQSAISGELEPLRNVGVALSQNTLQELANSLGIKQRVADMNEAQKAQLRYIQILKSSSEWQTDMGRTLLTPANTIRVMKEQVSLLGKAIGRIFIPIIMQAMPYVMALTQMLTELGNKIAGFLGYKIADIDYSGLGEMNTFVGDIGDTAQETTKKLNTMLAPFDELNVVQTNTKGAVGGLGSLGGELGVDLPAYDALANLTKQFGRNVKNAKDNLNKLFNVALKIAKVFAVIWATKKLLSFGTALENLFYFMKTGNKITKDSNGLFGNMVKRFKESREQGGSLTTSLRNMLTPMQKIVTSVGLMATSFGLAYVDMKSVGNGSKDLLSVLPTLTLKIGALATAVGLLVNPLAGLATGLIGVIGGLAGFVSGADQTGDATSRLSNSIAQSKQYIDNYEQSMRELKDTINEELNANLAQVDYTKNLRNELETLVNSNGKVKKGYENRVKFILNELNNAYGTEYKLVDGMIEKYDEFEKNIDQVIEKQRAQYILDANRELYMKSLEEEDELYSELEKARTAAGNAEKRLDDITAKVTQTNIDYQKALKSGKKEEALILSGRLKNFKNTQTEYQKTYAVAVDNEKRLEKAYKESRNVIQNYDDLTTAVLNGNADEIKKKSQDLTNAVKTANKEQVLSLADKIKQAKYNYDVDVSNLDSSETEKLKILKNSYNSQMQELSNELVAQTTTIQDLTPSTITAWATLAKSNKNAYNKALDLTGNMKSEIQNAVNTVTTGGFLKKQELRMRSLGSSLSESLSKSTGINSNVVAKNLQKSLSSMRFINKFFGIDEKLFAGTEIAGYAQGGYPTSGQFFLARENGAPELVGRIGNQTAVANNDQITNALTNALLTALSGVDLGGRSPIVVNIGNKKVYEGMGDQIDSESERYGTSYFNI